MDSSSSHVESRWRTQLRNRIIQASSLLEILLSGLVLIGLLLSAVPLIKWMPGLLDHIFVVVFWIMFSHRCIYQILLMTDLFFIFG